MTDNIQELLAQYRAATDAIDAIDEVRKVHVETKEQLKRDILARMEAEGMVADGDQVKGGGVTATIQKKWRARHEPSAWPSILAWATREGYTDLVQKRLTDSKVMDLVDSGVALPDGLNVEPFTDLACRRTG